MRVATRRSPGQAGADHMVAGEDSTTASVKGSLRRPPAALAPAFLPQGPTQTRGEPKIDVYCDPASV